MSRGDLMRRLPIAVLCGCVFAISCSKGQAAAHDGTATSARSELATPSSSAAAGATDRDAAASSDRAASAPAEAAAFTASAAGAVDRGLREVTIPSGTELWVTLDTPVASDTNRAEDAISGHLSRPVMIGGATVVPAGSAVNGIVTSAVKSGKVKGRAHLAMRFDSLTPKGDAERYRIITTSASRTARATKGKDAAEIGLPALGGAVVGGLVGGKKGAVIGGAAGGGAGTAVVLSTSGEEVRLGRGAVVRVRLQKPVTVRVPRT